METARTIVASYCFPPFSDTAGIVAAKRVREHGELVDVISNDMDPVRNPDFSLTRIGGNLVRRYATLNTYTAFSSWPPIESWVDIAFETYERWQAEQGPYEKLYSRAQFAASHFLAAKIKLHNPGIHWLAEFSDPLSHDVLGDVRSASLEMGPLAIELKAGVEALGYRAPVKWNLLEWCEVITFALADDFMFTNQLQMDFMLDNCGDSRVAERVRDRAHISPHPTLPREFYTMRTADYELAADKVNIGYFGNFYANRGVGLILDALAGLPAAIADKILLHVFTSKPEDLEPLAEEKGVARLLRIGPYRDYLEFLNLADRMDVLLINDATTPAGGVNPFLPSKWSDYKGSSTPVWGIIEEGSTLDQQDGIAYRTPVEHLSGIQATLAQIVADSSK